MKEFKVTARSVYSGHYKITYNGIEAIKCPFDYVIYQMILFDIKPDLVIEIGSNKGGGALYMADILNNIGFGIVHTIDIVDNFAQKVKEHPRVMTFVTGYQGYDLSLTNQFKKILVIEDASHKYEDCINCLNKFTPIVSIGSYYIVEDGIVNKLGMKKTYNGGPKRAIKEFLNNNRSYELDNIWCNMFGINATFNINGYLKRMK